MYKRQADAGSGSDSDIGGRIPVAFQVGLGGARSLVTGSVDSDATLAQLYNVLKGALDAETLQLLISDAWLVLADSDVDPFAAGEEIPKWRCNDFYVRIMNTGRVKQRVRLTGSATFNVLRTSQASTKADGR